jgi:MHS family shikimate/dehydroshikimate transporter-like MFS transporter
MRRGGKGDAIPLIAFHNAPLFKAGFFTLNRFLSILPRISILRCHFSIKGKSVTQHRVIDLCLTYKSNLSYTHTRKGDSTIEAFIKERREKQLNNQTKVTNSENRSIRKVAFASLIGTSIEWYDFFLYGTAAALVFNRLFFPTFDPLTGTLAALGTYAVGFAARPVGGIICGHFGDRIGRRSMLVITLLTMGIATFLIGLLPTYDRIGIWAPIILVLLRIAQGFGLGGEWGGAVLMAVEHSPTGKRGLYGSFPQTGLPIGLLLSTLVFGIISRLPEAALFSWGWRVAFLLSVVMVGVGLYIRLSVEEPPVFKEVKQTHTESKRPILEALRQHPKNVLLVMGARILENGVFYIFSVFVLTYATLPANGFSNSLVLYAVSAAAFIQIFTIPAFGVLSDRLGRRPIYLFGAVFTGVLAFPFFWLIDTSNPVLLFFSLVLALSIAHAAMYAPQSSFFAELFGTRVRYSGLSVGYQLASVIAGGLSPIIATGLLRQTGSASPVALYIILMAIVTTVSVYLAAETSHQEIADSAAGSRVESAPLMGP